MALVGGNAPVAAGSFGLRVSHPHLPAFGIALLLFPFWLKGVKSNAPGSTARGDEWLRTEHLNKDLRQRSISGGAVTVSSQGVKFCLSMVSAAVMARLLSPADFGIVAMALGTFGFLHIFKEAGLSTATVQRQGLSTAQVSNLFWVNLAISGCITLLMMALSPLIAWFFREPRLVPITCVLSLTFVLNGAAVQHLALLNRQMQFRTIAFIEIFSMAGSLVIGIAMALLHCGAWALLGAAVGLDALGLVLTLRSSPWRPGPWKRNAGTRSLLRFGAHLTAGDFFLSLVKGLDTTLIGRVYGTTPVGLYSRAYSLLMRPLDQVISPVSAVLLPALARVQSDPARYRRSFLRAFEMIATVSFFSTGLLLSLAHPITLLLLGPKWESAAAMFAGFTLAALYMPFAMASRWLFTTQGRGGEFLKANFTVASVTAIAIVAGLPFGPLGVAIAFSLSGCLVRMPILFYLSGRRGAVGTRDLWVAFGRHVPLWAIVGSATFAAKHLLRHHSYWLQLLGAIPVGVAAGLAFILNYPPQRRVANDLWSVVVEMRQRRRIWLLEQRLRLALRAIWPRRATSRSGVPDVRLQQPRACTWDEVRLRLNPYKLDATALRQQRTFTVREVWAEDIADSRRFDVYAKHLYARHWAAGRRCRWAREVYDEHLAAFNGRDEGDGSGKRDLTAFLEAYEKLLASVAAGGFNANDSLVPVTASAFPLDGGHRLAACLHYRRPVSVVEVRGQDANWNHAFFRARGMPESHLDAVAMEYCRTAPNPYVVFVYPSAVGHDEEVEAILSEQGQIFYAKQVWLEGNGPVNLIRQIYAREPWVGTSADGYAGTREKSEPCFAGSGPLRVYVCAAGDLRLMQRAKQRIRDLFRLEKHSVHINDTPAQALEQARLVLNANSIHFLNNAEPAHLPRFERCLSDYRAWLTASGADTEDYCVDGSASLAAYGLRDVADLDFLQAGTGPVPTGLADISDHTSELHHHVLAKDDILYHPGSHFYYYGLKFLALNPLRAMKARRGERKDLVDVEQISQLPGLGVPASR
jgi:PST family polysaccharide transporter